MDLKPLNDLLNKEMTRKDFLKHIGVAALGIMGVNAFLRNITNPHNKKSKAPRRTKAVSGYGAGSTYGT
jgi:arginine exporter protein ArgO